MNPCKLVTETIDEDKVKQWYICQIEDKRDALNEAQKSQAEEVDLEEVNRQLEILNAEKKRRGYR